MLTAPPKDTVHALHRQETRGLQALADPLGEPPMIADYPPPCPQGAMDLPVLAPIALADPMSLWLFPSLLLSPTRIGGLGPIPSVISPYP